MPTLSLILPGHPLFAATLAESWSFLQGQNPTQYYCYDSTSGLARPATAEEVEEYLLGGECDEALGQEWEYELD